MLDHIAFPVKDYTRSLEWYLTALKPLRYTQKMEFEHEGTKIAGLGDGENTDLWIWQGDTDKHSFGKRYHVAFGTKSHEAVKEFHEAAIAAGGTDNGAPGPRAHYHSNYYGAFVYDLDGNNVEVVCHCPLGGEEKAQD